MAELMREIEKKDDENIRLSGATLRKYRDEVATEQEKQKLDELLEDFDKKLEKMEEKLSSEKKDEPSREDLFDTINYLNEQNEMLQKGEE